MTTLVLGVTEIPYNRRGGKTTADVADILEAQYGIMSFFWGYREKQIVAALTDALRGSLESLMMGAPVASDPYASGTQQIEKMFREMVGGQKMDGAIRGVPTMASLQGVNHRLKHPYAKANKRRPSFWDTGLYVNSFRAWTI